MTVVMVVGKSHLPRRQRYALPPRQILETALQRAGISSELSHATRDHLTELAHATYGAGAGTLYGVVAPRLRNRPLINGMAYGFAVWAGSYLGWLPTMRFPAAATREPAERNALMITAHLVWGGTLGLLESWSRNGKRSRPNACKVPGSDTSAIAADQARTSEDSPALPEAGLPN
jgi:putative membrane protein